MTSREGFLQVPLGTTRGCVLVVIRLRVDPHSVAAPVLRNPESGQGFSSKGYATLYG